VLLQAVCLVRAIIFWMVMVDCCSLWLLSMVPT
jgi:hypothetical protein